MRQRSMVDTLRDGIRIEPAGASAAAEKPPGPVALPEVPPATTPSPPLFPIESVPSTPDTVAVALHWRGKMKRPP